MQEWWSTLDLFMKSLWGITIFASLVFIVETIMTFVGMDSDIDIGTDVDFDTDTPPDSSHPFQLFTFRNFINFFLGFGWTAIALRSSVNNTFLLLLIAAIVGILLVTAVMYIFKWLSGMEQSGNIRIQTATGCKGTVYLTIPGKRQGEGKVQISIQGAIREYNAVTDGDKLANGTPIRVKEALNENTLLVEKQ
ncbi:NfeD family protein [Parabacteroides pacaensis]|uniref:NfeD family protein n=1 Tax=Parabacteroides pacaensis TaxID=2086575 RepID=UPI000D1107EB|nr:NfeD family protein [Parabacteroides pacaensis]